MKSKIQILLLAVIALLGATSYASTGKDDSNYFVQEEPVNQADSNIAMYAQGNGVPECTDPQGRCYTSTPYMRYADASAASVKASGSGAQKVNKRNREAPARPR